MAALLCGAAAASGLVSLPNAEAAATSGPSRVVLNPTADPSTSQTISWRTKAAYSGQAVEVVKSGDSAVRTVPAKRKKATSVKYSGSKAPQYTATVKGLLPGTSYTYRIVSSNYRSSLKPFRTATSGLTGPWSFISLGDTQVENATVPAAIIRAALKKAPDARLVLEAGDVVNRPYEDREWFDLFKATTPVRLDRNLIISIGNHEQCILVQNCRSNNAEGFKAYFQWPNNGYPDQGRTWFYTDYQGVRFVVIDSFGKDIRTQAAFLDKALKDNPNKWSVVLEHAAPFASRGDRTNATGRKYILPVLAKRKVDLVLSGHDHSYARGYYKDKNGTVFATSVSGPKFYTSSAADWKAHGATRVKWARHVATYQIVKVTEDSLIYTAVVGHKGSNPSTTRANGAVLDKFVISEDETGSKTVTW